MRRHDGNTRFARLLGVCLVTGTGLWGCQAGDSGTAGQRSAGPGIGNSAPSISGDPPAVITAGESYSFTPIIEDADGDKIQVSVIALPGWATFDSETGSISGTPTDSDIGIYPGIEIVVSDGNLTDALGPFSIEVIAQGAASGTVTLRWTAPTANTDGSLLRNLAGYRIYWGPSVGDYRHSVFIGNVSVTRYVISGLDPGTYAFVATAVNAEGVESNHSRPTTTTVD